jgi:hypothetical protein
MKRHSYRVAANSLKLAFFPITLTLITLAGHDLAWAVQPQKGDADRLRVRQGEPILPTNTDQFAPSQELPSSNLKIQNINLEVNPVEPVVPGNYNAAPQKVNRSGNFSSDPLNAIPIFQERNSSRSRQR